MQATKVTLTDPTAKPIVEQDLEKNVAEQEPTAKELEAAKKALILKIKAADKRIQEMEDDLKRFQSQPWDLCGCCGKLRRRKREDVHGS